jgi:DNA mismatch endonuclease, patch repair protein
VAGAMKSALRPRPDPGTQPFRKLEKALVGRGSVATTAAASARMGRVRQKRTAPELAVGQIARSLGLRLTTHNRDLPGSPDFANRSRKIAIFVHGCFWHRHRDCKKTTTPKRNRAFWQAKFHANQLRDRRTLRSLRQLSFSTLVIWECETAERAKMEKRLSAHLPKI